MSREVSLQAKTDEVRLYPLPGSRYAVSMRGDAWKEEWSIEFLCKVMRVTSRGFRAWKARPMSQRQRDDMVILAHIREQHRLSLQSYGRPRMTEELQELGVSVGHGRGFATAAGGLHSSYRSWVPIMF